MSAADFAQLFRAQDPQVIEEARAAGPAAIPLIEPFLGDRDYYVRVLAVNATGAAGGPRAPSLLIRALADENEQVRDSAVNALHVQLPQGQQAALLQAWDRNQTRDGYVRQQIPMVVGRLKDPAAIEPWRIRLPRDSRQQVRDGVVAGLAKLGDPEARHTLGEMLRDARDKRTAEVVELAVYEDEPWVIPKLVPVLQRRGIAVRIATHIVTIERRECDIAVDAVLKISRRAFSFPLNESARYTDSQIEEVLAYARAQEAR